jgi:hypothetical protein
MTNLMEILIGLALVLTVGGVLLMHLCAKATRETLKREVIAGRNGDDAPVIKPILTQPYNEILLGILFTVSTPFFALWCVIGEGKSFWAAAVAAVTAGLTSFGTYARRKEALTQLGAIHDAKRIRVQLIAFSISLFFFLSGLVLGAILLYHLKFK